METRGHFDQYPKRPSAYICSPVGWTDVAPAATVRDDGEHGDAEALRARADIVLVGQASVGLLGGSAT
jgi:hypothetical protein